MVSLSGLRRYPVKSCRGAEVTRAVVERAGLAGDRRWMLVRDDGAVVTARTHPRLVLVAPTPAADGLRLTGPGMPPLTVPVPDGEPLPARVHRWDTAGVPAGPEADAWFSDLLGSSVRLLHLDDPARRRPDPDFSHDDDRVSFADGYPLLLTSAASLDALNALVAEGRHAAEAPLPMTRFRPNAVVEGAPAWAEDGWRRIRIGVAEFRVAKGCARCVLTTVDPGTAAKGREPMATLAQHRRFDGKVWFGVNLIPDDPGAEITVGDPVEVLDAVDPACGPPR
ncbi:MOSC domain-containing protein [Pseudonocardia sp. EV170527-09]|uniref:MOSC domain-containing protein n=1 Tax=Pseudonocardia sp. EV170527-09 TaxID=2603411 RepID=UPI0011F134FE|nr:MOSC N-terminal beta barrel domain-containing protein [Pseudonocardia sp. EV170527-09]KAA1019026.1 MOSC domain-containing protein [Pseudonocardia sp. EV170527-09]